MYICMLYVSVKNYLLCILLVICVSISHWLLYTGKSHFLLAKNKKLNILGFECMFLYLHKPLHCSAVWLRSVSKIMNRKFKWIVVECEYLLLYTFKCDIHTKHSVITNKKPPAFSKQLCPEPECMFVNLGYLLHFGKLM